MGLAWLWTLVIFAGDRATDVILIPTQTAAFLPPSQAGFKDLYQVEIIPS